MFAKIFRTTGILSFTIIVSGFIVVSLGLMVIMMTSYSKTPAHFLPAEHTIALVHSPTPDLLEQFSGWFPEFESLETLQGVETIAMVQLPENKRDIVVFSRERNNGNVLMKYGKEETATLLQETPSSLRHFQTYTSLASQIPPQTSWMFLNLPLVEQDSIVHVLMAHGWDHAALTKKNDTSVLHLIGSKDSLSHITTSIPVVSDDDLLSFTAFNPLAVLQYMYTILPEEEQKILELLAREQILALFGEDISMRYDIGTLLMQPSSLQVRLLDDQTVFVLKTSMNAKEASPLLDQLHRGYLQKLSPIRVVEQLFDNRFPAKDVRIDPSLIHDETSEQKGWTVRETKLTTQSGSFVTALRGSTLLLGTDQEALDLWINNQVPMEPDDGRNILASGVVDVPTVLKKLQKDIPTLRLPVSPLLPRLETPLHWSITRQGGMVTVTLKEVLPSPRPSMTDTPLP